VTNIAQAVGYSAFAGATSKTLTLSPTKIGNSIIVLLPFESGTTQYTAPGVTDNAAGGSNLYVVRKALSASGGILTTAWVVDCLNAPKSCTLITIAPTGGSGGGFGCGGVLEGAGGTYSADQSGSTSGAGASPLVATNSSIDTGNADLVVGVACIGGGSTNAGITDPPSGYTSLAVQQDDSVDAASECCYRINANALQDSISWVSVFQTNTAPGILQSYRVDAPVAGTLKRRGRQGGLTMGLNLAEWY
jgi:hypothetical protein